jgi:hypothetical protein
MTITGSSRPFLADPPPDPRIPLPPPSSDERFRRRKQQRRVRRQRYLVAVVFLAALAGTLVLVNGVRGGDGGGASSGDDGGAAAAKATVAPVLLTEAGPTGRAAWLTAVVPGTGGKGGTLLFIPPGTMAEVPSLGLEPVGNALAVGGGSRLLFTAENVVGASLGTVEQLDAARLAGLIRPAGALTVELAARVEDVLPSGRVQVLYEPGPNRIEPDEVSRFLAAKGRDNDLARLARHQALWDAWLRRLADDSDLIPDPGTPLGKALTALARGRWQARVLPVEAVGTLETGDDIYRVDREELATLVRRVFPDAGTGSGVRPRIRILNGTGELELAQRVASVLVPAGVEVTLTGNADPLGQRVTQVIYYDPDERPVAERVRAALGVGVLVRNRTETDVVDVTVIVGKDFPPQT